MILHKPSRPPVRNPRRPRRDGSRRIGPTPLAGRLALVGLPILTASAGAYAARIHDALLEGEVGLALRLGPDGEALAAAIALLLGGVLLLDWMERREARL